MTPKQGVSSAVKEAHKIVEAANKKAEDIYQKAREDGYEAGLLEATKKMVRTLSDLSAVKSQIELQGLELAVEIAKKILSRELTVNEEAFTEILVDTLGEAQIEQEAMLVVHPSTLDRVESVLSSIHDIAPGVTFKLVSSDQVRPGGIMLKTALGDIDSSIEQLVEQIAQELREC